MRAAFESPIAVLYFYIPPHVYIIADASFKLQAGPVIERRGFEHRNCDSLTSDNKNRPFFSFGGSQL